MAGKGEGLAIGIDLGTTYSCVGVWQHDRVEIIANDQGNRTTPSYVAFTDTERLIGDAAKNQVAMNPINTVFEDGRINPKIKKIKMFPKFHRRCASFNQKHATRSSRRDAISFIVKAAQEPSASLASQDRQRRRQVIAFGTTAPLVFLFNQHSNSFAAENKKGFLPVLDKKDGYSFLYPFGWQEVVIEGQDKVFKDVIEPLENVSVNVIPTGKQDITEFGSPQEVAETLIKKVLAPPNQKTKIVEAKEQDVEGKKYYQFEFIAKAPNYTRHALSTVSIGNGKFYTLTTGANERRWDKMKDRLQTVIESFKIFDV